MFTGTACVIAARRGDYDTAALFGLMCLCETLFYVFCIGAVANAAASGDGLTVEVIP